MFAVDRWVKMSGGKPSLKSDLRDVYDFEGLDYGIYKIDNSHLLVYKLFRIR
jgi:hypothetical protein